ncbi:MAG: TIGR00341 family protein [Chloroflexota bacterium]
MIDEQKKKSRDRKAKQEDQDNRLKDVDQVPDYADVVVVPVANPSTAADLLHVAGSLVDPENGKIVAVSVSLGDAEKQAGITDDMKAVIDNVKAEGLNIELKTVVSTSVSRGILDQVRETGADLLLIGIKQSQRGRIELGTVVENVMETAPCDVLIYRWAKQPDYQRIVIPIDRVPEARVALRIGMRLAMFQGRHIEAICPQPGHRSQYEGLAKIEEAAANIPGSHRVKRTVINAVNPVQAVLTRTGESDLVIVGFTERSDLERVMFGDFSRGMLERADGPVILVSRSKEAPSRADRYLRRVTSWLQPALTRVEQDELMRQADTDSRLNIDYVALILVSAAIAALGLLLNNVAVIIGAMLVAPLIQPLIALASSLTVGRVRVAWRALFTLFLGVILALIVSYIVGALQPSLATPEMISRGQPTLLDAAVALAGGAIGAYATARRDIPAALAGVAIAAALMPPLCTAGLGLAIGDQDLAFGAMVLFLTNMLCIIIAGMLVFFYLGMSFRRYENTSVRLQIFSIVLLLAATVPIGLELYDLTKTTTTENVIRQELVANLPEEAELVEIDLQRGRPIRIIATVRSVVDLEEADTSTLQADIGAVLGEPAQLELVVLRVVLIDVDPADDFPQPVPEATAEQGA